MEVTINYNGQAVAVEVTLEVYEFLDQADHKAENLSHEQRRHWDGREFDEYQTAARFIVFPEMAVTAVVWLVWGIDDLTQKSNLQSFRFTHEFWA